MVGIRRIKLFIGIFIPFLVFFLMSQNTFAAQFNSWLNIQDISKTNLSNDWITHNTSHAGSYSVSGSTRLETYQISASANLSSALSGPYFNASATIYINIPNDLDGGLVCSAFTNGGVVPEIVSLNITSTSVSNCSYESSFYFNKYTININSLGSFSSGSPSSFYFYLVSDPNQPFISLIGTPDNSPRVFISGDINFSTSSSPELNSLTEINQNITVISDELDEYHQHEYESVNNIESQSSSDIEGVENQQTTNLIGVITRFITAISGISATNCRMRLNFPDFAGGSQLVDICQGKDKAPAIISLGSNVLLIMIFVPLAFILLRMIYNEIRSWTSG